MAKKIKFFKIISWIIVILPILCLIAFKFFLKGNIDNYIVFVIIECINIIILTGMSFKKFEIKKTMLIVVGIYLTISILIPVYSFDETFTPVGMNSHLMGLGLKRNYVDVYGINITNLVNLFE